MTESHDDQQPKKIGRIALIGAAVLAVGAVGVQISKSMNGDAEAPTAAAAPQGLPDINKIIGELEKKAKDNPNDAAAWRELGGAYFDVREFPEAATALKRATTLDPKNVEYWSLLGEALASANQGPKMPDDAAEAFRTALKLDPKDARSRYYLADFKALGGDSGGAIEDLFALLADTPVDAPYTDAIRSKIKEIAKKKGIDITQRLATAAVGEPTGGPGVDGAGNSPHGGTAATNVAPGLDPQKLEEATKLPPAAQKAFIATMVEKLDKRLQANPQDATGWIMLMRSRIQLGENAQAKQALDNGLEAFKNDPAQAKKIKDAGVALGL